MRKNNRGFTLVEMLVVVALMGIISVLLLQTWQYVYASYQRSEMLYIQQNAANQVADWIEENTRTSTRVDILYRKTSTESGYSYIYSSDPNNYENSQIMYYDSATGTTGVVTDVPLELHFFTKDLGAGSTSPTSKAMDFSVAAYKWDFNDGYSTTDYSYTTDSTVSFPNMARAIAAGKSGYYIDEDGKELGLFSSSSYDDIGGTAIQFKTSAGLNMDTTISLGDGGCFIATAAYGSRNDTMVATLRMFRDEVLLQSEIGSAFVDFYYRVSPPIADSIAQSALARWVVRVLLSPLVVVATLMIQPAFIGLGCATLTWMYLLWRYVYPSKRKRLHP